MKKGWKFTIFIYGSILIITVVLLSVLGFYQRKMSQLDLGTRDESINYEYHFAFISSQKNVSFWDGIYLSAKERGKELGIYVEQLGGLMTEDYSLEEQLEIAIASKVDGIMIEPNGQEVMDLINLAGEENIPVVTLMEDEAATSRISYIGVSSYEQGRALGLQIKELVKVDPTLAQVTVLSSVGRKESSQDMIYRTILEEVKELNLQIDVVEINGESSFRAAEDIRKIIMNDQAPDLLVCLSPGDTLAAYQGVVDYNKVGVVKIIGYYDSELIPSAIEKNIVECAVQIDGSQMGAYGVDALYEFILHNRVSEFFPVDIQIVNKEITQEMKDIYDGEQSE